jgi:hypothetical protein
VCVCVCVRILHYPEQGEALLRTDPPSKEFYEMSTNSIYKTIKWISLGHAGV